MTYPNVLVLDYVKSTDQTSPELQMQAEQYIAQGYQRLLTFEVDGGGFSLFGGAPAQVMLTAYGLMEFSDMSKVHYVDPALIERTAQWLMNKQQSDGSWKPEGLTIESGWERVMDNNVPATAYVVWALVEAGYADTPAVANGLAYLKENVGAGLKPAATDPYLLALAANALAAGDPKGAFTGKVLNQLDDMKVVDGDKIYWESKVSTFMGGSGNVGSIETTAMVAYAMMVAEAHPDTVNGALNYLVAQKDSFGTWQTTQATILSLKAFLLSATRGARGGEEATVRISLNGEEAGALTINAANADVVHLVTFTDKAMRGDNRLQIEISGERALMYQVVSEYYLPWDMVPPEDETIAAMSVEVSYDRTELQVNDTVEATAWVKLNREGMARMAIVDLGVPPGFAVVSEDLDELVRVGRISRYEIGGRQVIIYLENFSSEEELEFSYQLRAKFPLKAKTGGASTVYDYYTPENRGEQRPLEIVVVE